MECFTLEKNITLSTSANQDPCYRFAVEELCRLLGKLGISTVEQPCYAAEQCLIGLNTNAVTTADDIRFDGFVLALSESSAILNANEPKGILNAVYELAERLGITFLYPGEDGEWIPEQIKQPETGHFIQNPRFPYRGLFFSTTDCYSLEEHLHFMAKLKFNVVRFIKDTVDTAEYKKMGFRREMGAHLLPKFLDRELYKEHPEYFRMFQPSDFGGKRMADSNYCITNSDTRRVMAESFQKFAKELAPDVSVVHAWADDLPSSGWCMCPSCRSFTPCDQNMLSVKMLCRAADAIDSKLRFSVIAYHDTLFPSKQIPLEKRMLLTWAPRERCYAHAINDPTCERNHIHWQALQEWNQKLDEAGIDDTHTFEYYCDQLLFTGMYPFLPDVIAEDAKAYKESRIAAFMTLQVCSWGIMPDYSELFFARVNWDEGLTTSAFTGWISERIAGNAVTTFRTFLEKQAEAFQKAMLMCGHELAVYLDYRFLPESIIPFADKAAAAYGAGAEQLEAAAEEFSKALPANSPLRFRKMAEQEIQRIKFEAAQLRSMFYQQSAMNCFGKAQVGNDEQAAKAGCEFLKLQISEVEKAMELVRTAGYPDEWHYNAVRGPWAIQEAKEKLENYSRFTAI
ncbi:MAG: DUF4838 domain-containing protein [Lentisphaeria bacterium]|nr:DUF4838 domain-containing protein [Lentisphaeria bacterium]